MESPKFRLIYFILLFSFVGLLDAGFLTYKHYTGGALKCDVLNGCDVVTTSIYSTVLGLPVSLYGLVFYLTVFIISLIIIDRKNFSLFPLALYFSTAAFGFSLYLAFLQLFVLKAFCLYCAVSLLTTFLIFACAVAFRMQLKSRLAPPSRN